ncbi:MAG: AtpZ/AtpI family protein [Phycisphaeraceae bacterium]
MRKAPDQLDSPGASKRGEPNPMVLVGAGVELGGVVAVLTLGGWWLDARWDTEPWLMFAGLAVGLVGGTYNVWRIAKRFFSDL